MSWELVTKDELAHYARITTDIIEDYWYDDALALAEKHTGWHSLSAAVNIAEYINGNGDAVIVPKFPINSVTEIQIVGTVIPASYYYVSWNGIEYRSYIPGELFDLTVQLGRSNQLGNFFPYGIRNIYLSYNAGGVASLPDTYNKALHAALLMIIKEFSTTPRSEGSDSMLKKYRPDRTMNPEEVLTGYGMHGKIKGILSSMLPKQRVYL